MHGQIFKPYLVKFVWYFTIILENVGHLNMPWSISLESIGIKLSFGNKIKGRE